MKIRQIIWHPIPFLQQFLLSIVAIGALMLPHIAHSENKAFECPRLWEAQAVLAAEKQMDIRAEDQTYRLALLQFPLLKEQASAFIEKWIESRSLRIHAIQRRADRYGRCAAIVYDAGSGKSLQAALMAEGLAVVAWYRQSEETAMLQAEETKARAAKRGLWAAPDSLIVPQIQAGKHIGRWRIVEGKLLGVAEHKEHLYLNFGTDWKTDFTGFISARTRPKFDEPALHALIGKVVQIRGHLYPQNGPAISLSSPLHIAPRPLAPETHSGDAP